MYLSYARGYLLCVLATDRRADTPSELVGRLRGGCYVLCELGMTEEEAAQELSELSAADVRGMAEATLGPWLHW